MQLAIMLEQANQVMKQKAFVDEQLDELRAAASRDRSEWMQQRDAILAGIRGLVNRGEARAEAGAPKWGSLNVEDEQAALTRVKWLVAEIDSRSS
jgi:hypothetical protein